MNRALRISIVAFTLAWAVAGCKGEKSTERASQKQRALAAKTDMFEMLSGRLKEVAGQDGFAAAVDVCAKEAPVFAEAVADASGVRIGRTSERLRNPKNLPPPCAKGALAKQPTEPTFVELDGGRLGALYPIRLKAMCENCHGDPGALSQPVKTALANHYPADQATGYKAGDLRGWFWVEVPAKP